MFKHILMASDLSTRSERALRRAYRVAEATGARLTVLSVVDDDLPVKIVEQMKEEATSALTKLCASISDHAVEIRVAVADPVRSIVEATMADDVDLLCMGVHRPRPFWDLFSGTTMERIVRACRVPVLLVKNPADHDYERIAAGVDLSQSCSAAIRAAHMLAPSASMTAFHAYHVPYRGLVAPSQAASAFEPFEREAQGALDKWWAETPLPAGIAKPIPRSVGRSQALAETIANVNPELLAVGAHARAGLAPTVLGSFTEEILRHPPCDVLIVRG
ncbi:universal stress protein [Chachezhania sediminis]|uniref:universal stress protein n=1 Tax=Chachezhania sediminis TaxID=2599291 RepID=UPI00131CD03A|nr:universal stress protein [Chachezhania sediminis]